MGLFWNLMRFMVNMLLSTFSTELIIYNSDDIFTRMRSFIEKKTKDSRLKTITRWGLGPSGICEDTLKYTYTYTVTCAVG
jgi:hypothetical protein